MSVDFHLLKRKTSKGKTVYYTAFLSDLTGKNGKQKYQSVKSTGQSNRAAAEKVARLMLTDGKVLASYDSLRFYLLNFWNPEKSEYLQSKRAEGRKQNSIYLQNNKQRILQYVLPVSRQHNSDRQPISLSYSIINCIEGEMKNGIQRKIA